MEQSGSADPEIYEPKPALKYATTTGLQAGIVGAVVSAVQNALGTHNRGAAGVLTRSGGTIGFFAAMGATFAFSEAVVGNVREKNDYVNGAAAGCAAGFLAGIRARSLPVAVASCAVIGGAMGTFDYAGQLSGSRDARSETAEERRKKFFKQKPATAET